MKYTQKNTCRCCHGKELLLYLNLGKQPLANSYHKKEKTLPTVPLEVMLCKNCFHNQLSVVVDPDSMFQNYLYVSGTTDTFQKHTKNLAIDAVLRVKKKKKTVLDIACNDGTQLAYFRELGCAVYGVDPAVNLRPITKEKKIPVVVDYWTQKVSTNLHKKFDIITGTNVFAHVDDLDEFLLASKIALFEDGLLILEFPYANEMITHNEFDTVYHEHLSYFLVHSFTTLATRLGFTIVDIIQTPIHGGSIRFFLKKGSSNHCEKVTQLIAKEHANGLLEIPTYRTYAKRIQQHKKDMKSLLNKLKKENRTIIGFGASAKGNTMLNYFKINLDFIIDNNELKWDYFTPGRNILIKSPQALADQKNNLYIVILSWNFYNEIVKKILSARPLKKDHAIVYVPKVETRAIWEKKVYAQSG